MPLPSTPPSSVIQFLVRNKDGTTRVSSLTISDGERNDLCVGRIRALILEDANIATRFAKQLLLVITMRKPVVGTVPRIQLSDPEMQAPKLRYVYETRTDDAMTNILVNASTPIPTTKELRKHLLRGMHDDNGEERKVWCYYHARNAVGEAVWLLMALMVSIIVGLSVGDTTGDGKLGLGVGGGVFVVLATVHAAILMYYKE